MKKKPMTEKKYPKDPEDKIMVLTEVERKALRKHFLDKMVHLPTGWWMGKYPVTQADWNLVMDVNPSRFRGDDLPVENVSWDNCQTFINRLNELTGETFRLPSENKWEKACRAGSNGDFGNVEEGVEGTLDEMGWYEGNSDGKTHPVGQKRPNAWGLYDMHGNVWEWTMSGVIRIGEIHSYRGGSCWCCAGNCVASGRGWNQRLRSGDDLGFRLVLYQMETIPTEKGKDERQQAVPSARGSRGSGRRGDVRPEVPTAAERVIRLSKTEKTIIKKYFLDKMVTIPNGLRMGKDKVTQADWKILVSFNPSWGGHNDSCVNNVSWYMCQDFIERLNAITGETFRLPTKEELEYAHQAGSEEDSEKEEKSIKRRRNKTGWGDVKNVSLEWSSTAVGDHHMFLYTDEKAALREAWHKKVYDFGYTGIGFRLALSRKGDRSVCKKGAARDDTRPRGTQSRDSGKRGDSSHKGR